MELDGFIKTHFRGLIAPEFIAGWLGRGIERLLPFQERTARAIAVEAARRGEYPGDRRMGRNALISAPTSAGKTLLAEIEIAMHLTAGRRAAYLVPTRALAEQKAAEFGRWLEPTGHRVVCATRDRPEADRLVGAGEFDLLVAVYEKMNHYMLAQPRGMVEVGLVVADEVQMVGDRERGGLLDLLLTKLRLSPSAPRIMAISAVINRTTGSRLAAWLDAEIYEDGGRPVDLREGVLDMMTGVFTYKDGRSGEEGTEWLAAPEELERHARCATDAAAELTGSGDPSSAALVGAAAILARRGEPVLIFAPTRRASRQWAAWLAEMEGGFGSAQLALPRLGGLEPGRTREMLRRCMERGVAFHNADLDEAARRIVEEAFNAGELRAVVATPTLAMGVNLSARNVVQCPWRYSGSEFGARTVRLPLGRGRFSNQGGRAARMGMGADFGRSILVAQSKAEAQRMWSTLVIPEAEGLDAPLSARHVPAMALDLLAGGYGRCAEGLAGPLAETFSARMSRAEATGHRDWLHPEQVRARLGLLARAEFIRPVSAAGGLRVGETQWALTGLGEVTATLGLSPEVALELREWLARHARKMARESESSFEGGGFVEGMFELGLTSEGRRVRVGLGNGAGTAEQIEEDPELGFEPRDFARLAGRTGGLSRDETSALNSALILRDWVSGVRGEEIEVRHRVICGSVARVAEEFEWLVRAGAALALLSGLTVEDTAWLSKLADQIRWGVPARLSPIAAMRVLGLGRAAILRLAEMGFDSLESFASASREELVELVGMDAAEGILVSLAGSGERLERSRVRRARGHDCDSESQTETMEEISVSAEPPSPVVIEENSVLIEINLRSPGVIRACGREVALPPTSFDLLALLAERPGEVVTRDAIYQRLWPEGGPEPQQIDGHRRTLIKRLERAIPREAGTIAEVIRGIGLRMSVAPRRISLLR